MVQAEGKHIQTYEGAKMHRRFGEVSEWSAGRMGLRSRKQNVQP